MNKIFIALLAFVLSGCKDKVSVTNQQFTPEYLASSFVRSPDPTREHFEPGVQLTLEWRLSKETLEKNPQLEFGMIFGDLTEDLIELKVVKRWGYHMIRVVEPVFSEKKGILTYRARIITEDGEVHAEWKHQLWTPLLHIEGETI